MARSSFLLSTALLLPFLLALIRISTHLHYTLPVPNGDLISPADGRPVFSEVEGMRYIRDMSVRPNGSSRYRIVGTEEMLWTEEYLLKEIERIKAEIEAKMGGLHEVEVSHQIGTGSHLFRFMDEMVFKKYYNITNIVVRLSDGTPASKANAILVNAHTDSTLPSPGAADDLIGVAAMLESLRVMGLTNRRLSNAVVFLFNGAEESLQDGSHLFITQHPLRDTIRAVINLEACGVGGPEIVFQATSKEMVKALSKTPYPYGTVLATEVFSTGLILSDTDFRQFAHYGNLTGLDIALVQNSYFYHTRQDVPEQIEAGALQHMGDNTLAMLEYLTSPNTAMGNSMTARPLPKQETWDTIYFSGLGGALFLVYTREQATVIYGVLASITAVVVADRVDWSRKKVYAIGALGAGWTFVGALVGSNLVAFVTGVVMEKPLAWFRRETFPIILFGPASALGATLVQLVISFAIRTPNASPALHASESSLLEHSTLVGQAVYYSVALLVGHAFKIAASYLFALSAISSLGAIILNDYVLGRKGRDIHLAAYFIGQVSPLLLGIEGLVGFLDLFVPLTGRLGPAPVDFIIASLVTGVGYLSIPMFLPFLHRFGSVATSRIAIGLTFILAFTMGWFTRPNWNQFDHAHPKRVLAFYMENTTVTPSSFNLYVAALDPAPFYDMLEESTRSLRLPGTKPEYFDNDELRTEWNILFPVDQFLKSYSVQLPPQVTESYVSPWGETFKLTAEWSVLNAVRRSRSLKLVLNHPTIMWPVLAFDADVLSWDLPENPERGVRRHHVKSVAAYGIEQFTLEVEIQLSEREFQAAIREDQRRKGQRADTSEEDEKLGSLSVHYSGLDRTGMYPASILQQEEGVYKPGMEFFKEMEKNLPAGVDSMLLSAVAAVAHV